MKKNKIKLDFLRGCYGWEKWFQVELAHMLTSHGEAHIEVPYAFDKRKKIPEKRVKNENAYIDVVFRKTNDLKNKYSAIEIKLIRTEQGLRQVLQDLVKVQAVLGSKWDFRSVIVVFIHGMENDTNTNYVKIKNKICEDYNVKPIGSEHFEFLIFGWEPKTNATGQMSHTSYQAWFKEIKEIFKKYGVTPKTMTKRVASKASDA